MNIRSTWIQTVIFFITSLPPSQTKECISMENFGLYKVDAGLRFNHLSLDACLNACLETSTCKAVNYNKNQRSCFMMDNPIRSPMYPSDCCSHYTKATGPCISKHTRPIVNNIEYSTYMRRRDLLNDKRKPNGDRKSVEGTTTKGFEKGDKNSLRSEVTTHRPFFVILNKESSGASSSEADSSRTTPTTTNATTATTTEKISHGSLREAVTGMGGNTTQSTDRNTTSSGSMPKSNVTEGKEILTTQKPSPNAPGTRGKEEKNKNNGEKGSANVKINGTSNTGDGKKSKSAGSALTPIHFEAPCKQNVTVLEHGGRMNQLGGQDVGMTMTSGECQDWCQRHERCVSVDYNLWEHSCWWHWKIGQPRNNTCCTHFTKIQTCQYDCFDIYHGYVLNASTNLLEEIHISRCRKECLLSENCTAFVYSNVSSSCWLYDFDITLLTSDKEPEYASSFSVKKPCYGSAVDVDIYISTTTQAPTSPVFTFPSIPSTLPPLVNGGGKGTTDQPFVMSPSSVVVLAGCSLVLLVGIGTLIGFMLHRRREKRALEASFAHPVIWMNDYGNFSSRGHSYWYPESACAEFSPGVAVNPAFQADDFPVGRTSAEFSMMATNGRCMQHPGASRVSRTRSYTDGFMDSSPSSYPTFPLRPLRVAVPSNTSAPSPVMTSPSTAHAQGGFTTFSSAQTQPDGRRLPRYEVSHAVNSMDEEPSSFRCAYP